MEKVAVSSYGNGLINMPSLFKSQACTAQQLIVKSKQASIGS